MILSSVPMMFVRRLLAPIFDNPITRRVMAGIGIAVGALYAIRLVRRDAVKDDRREAEFVSTKKALEGTNAGHSFAAETRALPSADVHRHVAEQLRRNSRAWAD